MTAVAAGDKPPIGIPGWAVVACGALSAIAGVLAIAYPKITLLALALISGINLLVLGALAFGEALGDEDADGKTLRIVVAIIAMLAGVVVLRRPGEVLIVLVIALGTWLIIEGVVELARALLVRATERRALVALGGAVDLVLGVVVLALPEISLRTLATLIGIAFVVHGGVMIARGLRRKGPAAASLRVAAPSP